MDVADEPQLTLDEACRAIFHVIHQYYQSEPIVPFQLMLVSNDAVDAGGRPAKDRRPQQAGMTGSSR